MTMHHVPKHLLRVTPILIAALCALGARPLVAQEAQQTFDVVPVKATTPAKAHAPAVLLPGPRLPALVAPVGLPALRDPASPGSSLALQDGGGRHTIVLSTLSLVLIVVILVLLI